MGAECIRSRQVRHGTTARCRYRRCSRLRSGNINEPQRRISMDLPKMQHGSVSRGCCLQCLRDRQAISERGNIRRRGSAMSQRYSWTSGGMVHDPEGSWALRDEPSGTTTARFAAIPISAEDEAVVDRLVASSGKAATDGCGSIHPLGMYVCEKPRGHVGRHGAVFNNLSYGVDWPASNGKG